MGELRIFGPPGTGKTTRLSTHEVPNAVKKYGSDKVVVASFTKAAATEIINKRSRITGKTIPVIEENVGTLHSLCYRKLSNPDIAELKKAQWNQYSPEYAMSAKAVSLGFDGADEGVHANGSFNGTKGDQLMNECNINRAKLLPQRLWSQEHLAFFTRWKKWKEKEGLIDFTDLIEDAIVTQSQAPNESEVIFIDEAQDFTPLQLKLVRQWAKNAQWLVLCGDDDQTIYKFTGAEPQGFLNPPVSEKFKRYLDQSYRMPEKIYEKSQHFISLVKFRQPKVFKPKNVKGNIIYMDRSVTWKNPVSIVNEAFHHSQAGKSVMIIGSCSYMIDPIKHEFIHSGIPFSNRYRMRRGDWNPLSRSRKGTLASKDLLLAFLQKGPDGDYWTIPQLITWAPWIKVGDNGLQRIKAKKALKELKEAVEDGRRGLQTSRNVLRHIFNDPALKPALSRNIQWFLENIKSSRKEALDFPVAVHSKVGEKGLIEDPKITIGTIHSVKGGEADIVYLFPDISIMAHREASHTQSNMDALYRLFYVGMTRTKDTLVIPSPAIKGTSRKEMCMDELFI